MTIILAFGIALLATGTAGAESSSTARVCFVRHEDNGRINLLAVRIYGSHGSREKLLVTLLGGDKKCMAVEAGSWSFDARSAHPYRARRVDPDACRSEPLPAEVAAGTMTKILVAPKSERSTYLCGWHLRLNGDAAQHGVAPVGRPQTAARR